MTYVNQSDSGLVARGGGESKRKVEKLLSLAMTNFTEPSVGRLYKVKTPLRGVASLLFWPPATPSSTPGGLGRHGGLLVADPVAGKVVRFNVSNGSFDRDVVSSVEPQDICRLETLHSCGSVTMTIKTITIYVCITTYQPDPKSNPNPNPTAKQHAIVNIQLNSHMSCVSR